MGIIDTGLRPGQRGQTSRMATPRARMARIRIPRAQMARIGIPRGWMPRMAAAAAIAALSLGGCAVSYVGEDGSRHIIGFARIVIPPADSAMPTAGNVIDLTTVGLSLNDMPEGQSLTLGYSRAVTATLKDHSLVLGNPLAIEEQSHALIEPSTAAIPVYDGGCAVCALPDRSGLR